MYVHSTVVYFFDYSLKKKNRKKRKQEQTAVAWQTHQIARGIKECQALAVCVGPRVYAERLGWREEAVYFAALLPVFFRE